VCQEPTYALDKRSYILSLSWALSFHQYLRHEVCSLVDMKSMNNLRLNGRVILNLMPDDSDDDNNVHLDTTYQFQF
jgi:hypothetical protein